MMKYIAYIFFLLSFVGCDKSDEETVAGEGLLSIAFSVRNTIVTRTALNSSDNYQHVQYVQLYIFDGTDGTAACIASKNVHWQQLQGSTTSQIYTFNEVLTAGKTYTLLAVGLDDASGQTYGLPGSLPAGTTLANAKAILQSGKTTADIAASELFAGSAVVTIDAGQNYTLIDLFRRVAGVLGYFKNIPYLINGSIVTKLQVVLYDNQNSVVPLMKPADNDFGTTPLASSTVLMSIDLSAYNQASDGNYYAIPAVTTGAVRTVENSVLKGAYVLPVNGSSQPDVHTLSILLQSADGTLLRTYSVTSATTPDTPLNFPLRSNNYYGIGIKAKAGDTAGDEPADLLRNQQIVIRIDPNWENKYDISIK